MPTPITVAALFVARNGIYWNLPHCDTWDERRDARKYAGPYPVVAHPPCGPWGRFATGGTGSKVRKVVGDDGGTFESALAFVRAFGGVIEHPEGSHAWRRFGLATPPRGGGWMHADALGGWTCCVAQGNYGHRARKLTWPYFYGTKARPPELDWSLPVLRIPGTDEATGEDRRRMIRAGAASRLSHRLRAATPVAFRDLLLDLARLTRPR
jgi:hypothetical protein